MTESNQCPQGLGVMKWNPAVTWLVSDHVPGEADHTWVWSRRCHPGRDAADWGNVCRAVAGGMPLMGEGQWFGSSGRKTFLNQVLSARQTAAKGLVFKTLRRWPYQWWHGSNVSESVYSSIPRVAIQTASHIPYGLARALRGQTEHDECNRPNWRTREQL